MPLHPKLPHIRVSIYQDGAIVDETLRVRSEGDAANEVIADVKVTPGEFDVVLDVLGNPGEDNRNPNCVIRCMVDSRMLNRVIRLKANRKPGSIIRVTSEQVVINDGGEVLTMRLQFEGLRPVDNREGDDAEDDKELESRLGEVVVRLFRVEGFERLQGQPMVPIEPQSVPQHQLDLAEVALKGRPESHRVTYADPVAVAMPTVWRIGKEIDSPEDPWLVYRFVYKPPIIAPQEVAVEQQAQENLLSSREQRHGNNAARETMAIDLTLDEE